ncbi:MAG: acyltransferase [Acidiphilium sp.]|nr:acyltransferase [Acidiphilium sp.]MDD4934380.1 acyltransferase [Acidiphilium sp.]
MKVPFPTIAQRITRTGGHASGFDYMRVCLSLSIVTLHSAITSYGLAADQAIFESPARPIVRMILPAFFALSGFLVAGSLERSKTLFMFLGLRVLRIYPALAVEVLLSAFILGPLLTTLPLHTYFSDPQYFLYLRNVLGDVHFYLPGMFEHNPLPNIVNGQLWTIPFELGCYITLAGIALLGVKRHRILGPIFVVLVTFTYLLVTLYRHHGVIVPVPGAINGALLIATFLSGVSIYMYRDVLPFTPTSGLISGVLSVALLGFVPSGDFLAPVPAAYFTVYLGLMNPSRRFLFGGDYSYGIFLYGFAIQQTIVYAVPYGDFWPVNILLSIPTVILFAAVSWHFVEKPAQRLRSVLKIGEGKILSWRQPAPDLQSAE